MTPPHVEPVYFLLVDDLDENLVALEALLRREGLVLLKARTGPDALELLLRHEVALALVDVQIPEMNGFELAELMRGAERTRRVPIIFLTAGTADRKRRFRGYEAGAVDFLHKPIEPDILRSKAEVFFELFRQRQEIARLLTESRAQADALLETDRRKNEFLAVLAHELRNPLAPLRNGLEVLQRRPGADETAPVREMMGRQLNHMVRLVDDLLDVSRISRGKIDLRRALVKAKDVASAAVEASRPTIDASRHELSVFVPTETIWLNADLTRAAQMLGNLLVNAAKYTPPGGRIELVIQPVGDTIDFRVTDTGIGIPKEMISRVFDLFTQVDRSLDRAQGGLGIGLSLVRQLAELHGGTVWAESAGVDKGSVFTIRLPRATDTRERPPPVSDEPSASATASLRILVVDDNADGVESLAALFTLLGHETRTAQDGQEALEMSKKFDPDVIFLDIGLPRKDGYEVARELRANAATRPVLVAVTGWGSEDDRRRTAAAGFDHHLTKPVEIETVTRILSGMKG
jgi:signal transduction histidine kinase